MCANIAICDDDQVICEHLKTKALEYAANTTGGMDIRCFFSGAELLSASWEFDLLLLDIQMPGPDGIELAKQLRKLENRCIIIFITALPERVFEAFEAEAFGYICKPVNDAQLFKVFDRAFEKLGEHKSLFVQTADWCKTVALGDIYYCEVIDRKVYVHTKQGVIEYYSTIEAVEKQLDYRFVRCHRSYMVNLRYVREYKKGQVTLENGESVPVSRLKHRGFMSAMMDYMKRKSV